MNIKHYMISGLLATTMVAGTTSCSSNFLDEELTTQYSTQYFETEQGLEDLAISLYGNIRWHFGYEWAYRLIDPRSLGIPQRRPRFVCIASRVIHPANLLFPQGEDVAAIIEDKLNGDAHNPYGFYWTEGKIGIGWANNSIPPLKCGSSLGLPSSPAVWNPMNDFFGMPSIHDAERLQGFDVDWTAPVQENGFKNSLRWKLLGNAVNTRVSSWIAGRIMNPNGLVFNDASIIGRQNKKWSKAGISRNGLSYAVAASAYPNGIDFMPILDYLQEPLTPLSLKATLGFRRRVLEGETGNRIILFVREFKKDILGTAPYTFLGQASYVSHHGSKPMNIIWQLEKPIPGKYLRRVQQVMG